MPKTFTVEVEEMPREKLERKGIEHLSDSEVLALLLKTGTQKDNVLSISQKILKKARLSSLGTSSLNELTHLPGIGNAKASLLMAAFEIGKRAAGQCVKSMRIQNADDAARLLVPALIDKKQEHFMVLLLDSRLAVIKACTAFIGTLNQTTIHPREIFRLAIKESANSIILAHNHPSGDTEPSEEDIRVTKMLVKAGELLQIEIVDHIIIGNNSYRSLKEEGII